MANSSSSWMRMRPEGSPVERQAERAETQTLYPMLRAAIDDEAQADQTYTDMHGRLQRLGFRRAADKVERILSDERRHKAMLEEIQRDITRR